MAPSVSTTSTSLPLYLLSFYTFSNSSNSSSFPTPSCSLFQPLASLSTVSFPGRCRAASPGPPPPPRTGPPPGSTPRQLQGLSTSLSKTKDRVQIFFAVLFWMSLFFWMSAWDVRNRPNKGSRS